MNPPAEEKKNESEEVVLMPVSKGKYTTNFPRAVNYHDPIEITKAFPNLKYVNSSTFDYTRINYADFFVIKSTNDDDVHKSIKYGIWTSSTLNNITFTDSWKQGKQVFLIFSVIGSEQFLGVAKMKSEFRKNDSFKYWWEGCKWFGMFEVEWVFIKDIKQKFFSDIMDFSINELRDGTYLEFEEGKEILQIFQDFKGKGNIFTAFELMDEREDGLRYKRENDENFKQQFEELSKNYSKNPLNVIPRKKYKKKPYQTNNYNRGYYNSSPYYGQQMYYNPTSYMGMQNPNYNYNYNNPYYAYNNSYQNYPPAQMNPYEPEIKEKPKYNSKAEPFVYKEGENKGEEEEKY